MKKLIKPTDREIDAAVAEHVAGMVPVSNCPCGEGCTDSWQNPDGSVEWLPRFSGYVDVVLPLLEKWKEGNTLFIAGTNIGSERAWGVESIDNSRNVRVFERGVSLPRTICIALLRAHGVEVEE